MIERRGFVANNTIRTIIKNIRGGLVLIGIGMLFEIFGIAPTGVSQSALAQSTPVTVGYGDFHFGTTVSAEPTSDKPQSKLWWNDGWWWGSLWNPAANRYEIHRFDVATQSWTATGTALDSRPGSRADALWDGARLYIVSQIYTTSAGPTANPGRLFRYSYTAASMSYTLDAGFPVNVNASKSEALVIDKDSTGKLWITWMEGGRVKINCTLGNDLTWSVPFDLPVQGSDTNPDDISTLVAFGGSKIGVMWSNQNDSTIYFAVHRDGDADNVWQPRETALKIPALGKLVDDHLNLKAACDANGNIYAATATNFSGSTKPGIFLLKRSAAGIWSRGIFAMAHLDHSRPVVMVNNENQRLYVFTRSNDTGPGVVYMKSASMKDLVFPPGLGTPFIQSATEININNPTAAKQCVNNSTGILILASDRDSRSYLHNYIDFAASAPQITSFTPVSGPVGTVVTITGSNFTGATRVTFNGIIATNLTVSSNTQLRATVPVGAATGKITVVNAIDAGASAANFTVTAPPKISSFTPADGPVGTLVKIAGNNFIGATSVAFNGKPATIFTVDSNTQLQAQVPSGATTGKIKVTNADGSGLSATAFTVTAIPIVSSFSPVRAVAGTEITITGSRFVAVTGVSFNDKPAAFTRISNTEVRATVPVGATTGPIQVTNSAGTGASAASFVAQYALTLTSVGSGSVNLNPPGGVFDAGTTVTLSAVPDSGWEFSDWDGDLEGTITTVNVTMNAEKKITAKFKAIPQFTTMINIVGPGSVSFDPPGGIYYRDTIVKLTAIPQSGTAGYVFSGYSGDFKGWMNVEAMTMDANKNITATFSPLPTPRYATGIWTSAAEISKLPTAGLGWENMKAGADEPIGPPNLSDREDSVNVAILAKALVYARTGDESYRQAVITACMAAIGTEQNGETLDVGRELMAYVLAADLVGLPPAEKTAFQNWLRYVLTENLKGQTLRSTHETRPNNWGTHCGATRTAIARYLGDATELERTARVFKGWLGDRNTYADFSYDPNELEWQANPNAPVGINPLGATIQGHSVDGVLPDDQRRSGPFVWPPPKENYVYGALQGTLMQAIILYRAGYDVWNWENQALLRALKWLHHEANYPGDGDDYWLIHIINHFYKSAFPAPFPASDGKNAGWTDWLYGSKYALTVSDNNGDIAIHSLGFVNDSLAVMKLTAIPSSNYLFNGWSGDLSGMKNPDTLMMNANKSVTANFVKAGPFKINVTTVGSGTVALNPPDSVYYGGTIVTLTATAATGFKFIGWSGDLTGTTNPAQLMITANRNITATFKAIYDLTVDTLGLGAVALNPPGGTYVVGTVVTLTASPEPGHQFVEWSGDLTGAMNPATITINAAKHVTATFTSIQVVHEEIQTGGSTSSTTVTTATPLVGAPGQLYLAAISTRSNVKVNAVAGLGLNWTLVKAQCAGRNNISLELWMAQGMPNGDGQVTATFVSAPSNAAIAVSRYSGVAAGNPVGNIISGNTKGADGICSGGADSKSYSFNLSTTVNGAVIYGVAAMRNQSHTPGTGYTERIEFKHGSAGGTASIAVEDKVVPFAMIATVNGAFDNNVDWVVVAVEIMPEPALPLARQMALAGRAKAPGRPGTAVSSTPRGATSATKLDGEIAENEKLAAPPVVYQLEQNYPNPFNPSTMINFSLPASGKVTVSIYDVNGQLVRTLVEGEMAAGLHSVRWNGANQSGHSAVGGVYLYRIAVTKPDGEAAFTATKRMTLLK
jgi:hypothetical protein